MASMPASRTNGTTRSKHHAPCHAPCTNTTVAGPCVTGAAYGDAAGGRYGSS